jgi:transcriptional regulator with XRE-family HTH domain
MNDTNPENPTFGALLRQQRTAKDLTLDQLAEKSGLSVPGIIKIEADDSKPDKETVNKLCDALGVDDQVRLQLVDAANRKRENRGPML